MILCQYCLTHVGRKAFPDLILAVISCLFIRDLLSPSVILSHLITSLHSLLSSIQQLVLYKQGHIVPSVTNFPDFIELFDILLRGGE